MEPIIKIIEGYNAEKVSLTNALNDMSYYSDAASQIRVKDIQSRIVTIDNKLEQISTSFLSPNLDKQSD